MRIARIIEYFPPHLGGMERHGLILSREQIKMGHHVDVFIGYGDENLLPNIYKAPFQFLPLYSKARRLWFNFWAARQVKKRHFRNPYNIIHLHGDFVEAYFGSRLAKKLNVPAVLTIHAGLNKKFFKSKNAVYFTGIKKIICVSDEIKQGLLNMSVKSEKISVISSGINLTEFIGVKEEDITAIKNSHSHPIIISVGVLRINKGFNFLINAFKKVIIALPKATLLIIGDGPEKNKLKNLAEGISGITFFGNMDHDDVIIYLKAADIFVLASVSTEGDREGTPTSIMEAMAAGLPVITTKVGGNPYLIIEGENGLLVKEKNSDELALAMIKLINGNSLKQKMHDKNLEDIKQKDWPIIAKKITDNYNLPL